MDFVYIKHINSSSEFFVEKQNFDHQNEYLYEIGADVGMEEFEIHFFSTPDPIEIHKLNFQELKKFLECSTPD